MRPPEERFCHNCGAPNPAEYNFCPNCGTRINVLRPLPAVAGAYPVRFDVAYPEKPSRLSTLVRLILAIPQLLIIYALGTVVSIITFIAWFAILFTRRYPKGLFDLVVGLNRWTVNVYAYMALLRSEYPPFSTDPGRYPVTYEVDYPDRLSRWLIFVKWFLAFLHQIVLYVLGLVALVAEIIAWFAILITGRFPRGPFNYIVGVMRWYLRVSAYTSFMTDKFPPYSRRADAHPGTGRAIAVSAVLAMPAAVGFSVIVILVFVGIFGAAGALTSSTEEVNVRYSDIRAGEATFPVDISGTRVSLLRAEDPFQFRGALGEPAAGHRFIRFELEVTNVDAVFTSATRNTFRLKDSLGQKHKPVLVQGISLESIERDRTVAVGVIFEIRSADQPSELTYSPGFRAFFPFGERVRFKFIESESRDLSTRASTTSPITSPRTYRIIASVDGGSVVSGSTEVDVSGLRIGPIEVEDPHPQAARALLADRPPDPGARYIAFYIPIENVDAPTAVIERTNFHLSATGGFTFDEPDFITFGGYARDAMTLDSRFSALVGLVYEVDNMSDPARLTYFPAFADPSSGGTHVVYFEFR